MNGFCRMPSITTLEELTVQILRYIQYLKDQLCFPKYHWWGLKGQLLWVPTKLSFFPACTWKMHCSQCWCFMCFSNLHPILMVGDCFWILKVVQLLETAFVNLINYASLVTTNAARHRFVVGKSKLLLEFGLRRAQVFHLSLR